MSDPTYDEMYFMAEMRRQLGDTVKYHKATPEETCAAIEGVLRKQIADFMADDDPALRPKVEVRQDPDDPTNYIVHVTPTFRVVKLDITLTSEDEECPD